MIENNVIDSAYPAWQRAKKKPIIISYREVRPPREMIHTREGVLWAHAGSDVIIRGVAGEEYPCNKKIFEMTYEAVP